MNEKIVMAADNYDSIDGKNAFHSSVKRLTLGEPMLKEHKSMKIAAQIWKENQEGELEISTELPIHQILDLMIFLGRSLQYFGEAYRFPLFYNPDDPVVERVGIQGGVMPVRVNTDNPNINEDIKSFSQAVSDLGMLTGERLRVLVRILEDMECY